MPTTKKIVFKSVAEAEKHFGGAANLLEELSKHATNSAKRTEHNKERTVLLNLAKQAIADGRLTVISKTESK